ncbi:AI-2E family transporter [Robiginitalea sp.]|uniref:AI-2E family transporter n=1 Tax=Robiginitalea sp. TaxID=1902411 RepID=UPI003C74F4B6
MKVQPQNDSVYDTVIRLLIILLIITWCLLILYPFTSILLWAVILAMALHPLHKKLSNKMGGKPKLTSFLIVFITICIIFIPSWFLIDTLIGEVKELKVSFDVNGFSLPPPTENVKEWPFIGERVYDLWQSASINLEQTIKQYSDQLRGFGQIVFKGALSTAGGIVQILASFIIAAIILVYGEAGEAIRKFFRKLAGDRGDEFADITMKTVSSVLKGVIGVAFILAVLHGILFMLAGVPHYGIWVLVVFVLGMLQLPLLFVTVPIIVYLFAVKSTTAAIIWTILLLLAGVSDNFLKPILLGKGSPVPTLVIFIGVIGGFILSGFIGLFTGAIVMSLGYKLLMGWMDTAAEPK